MTYYVVPFGGINPYTYGDELRHPDLLSMMPSYKLLRDVLNNRVKEQRQLYLPHPAPTTIKKSGYRVDPRYETYWQRAVWLPATRRTREGLVGQVFIKPPQIKLPSTMDYLERNASYEGLELNAVAANGLGEAISLGRGAFVADTHTKAEQSAGNDRGYINMVTAENILTWATLPTGRKDNPHSLRMVIVRYIMDVLTADVTTTIKIAKLVHYVLDESGVVYVRTAYSNDDAQSRGGIPWRGWQILGDMAGNPVKRIPVFFFGSVNNTVNVANPPMLELAHMNISHYCNTADYEDMVFVAGQATPVFTGLTEDWYKLVFKDKEILFGTRVPIPLPEGGDAKLLQISANGVAKEAVENKAQQMISIGARLIQERSIRRTATEADIEDQSYHSILGNSANNVSNAMYEALIMLYGMLDVNETNDGNSELAYKLNTDFNYLRSSLELVNALVAAWQQGLLSDIEMRKVIAKLDSTLSADAEAALALANADKLKREAAEIQKTKQMTEATASTQPPNARQ